MARIPMSFKELREGRRVGIPESIIGKMAIGIEPNEKEKAIINKLGKAYVEAHKKNGTWVKPQLRDLPGGSRSNPGVNLNNSNSKDDKGKLRSKANIKMYENRFDLDQESKDHISGILNEADELRKEANEETNKILKESLFGRSNDLYNSAIEWVEESKFKPQGGYAVSNVIGYNVELSDDGEGARVKGWHKDAQVSEWLDIEYIEDEETGELEPRIDPEGYDIPLNLVMRR